LESVLIENELEYILFLRHSRKKTEGTSKSYVTYLNAVTNHLKIDITKKSIRDIDSVNILLTELEKTGIDKSYWRNCQSALRAYLEFSNKVKIFRAVFPDEVEIFIEGAVKKVQVNKFERDLKARAVCISHYQPICQVCNFDFAAKYGHLGKNFIHVHHIMPISTIGKQYKLDPINDLIPVCPNCHAMLHMESPPLSISKLKELIVENGI
jgi:5-methylcytosine-specific restriction protein A